MKSIPNLFVLSRLPSLDGADRADDVPKVRFEYVQTNGALTFVFVLRPLPCVVVLLCVELCSYTSGDPNRQAYISRKKQLKMFMIAHKRSQKVTIT